MRTISTMMNNRAYILLFTLLVSCGQPILSSKDLIAFVEDEKHGLNKKIEVNDWVYKFQYKPPAYTMALENKGQITDSAYDKRYNELKGSVWVSIKFGKTNSDVNPLALDVSSLDEYNSRLSYYNTQVANDVVLLYNGDTLHPISHVFENNYGIAPYNVILVGFALPGGIEKPENKMQVVLFDKVYSNGLIKATFQEKDLQNILNYKVQINHSVL